jgi:hypothetical protein
MREKKLSIDSTPTRVGDARLAGTRFKILADLRFKLAFELFIRFKLHTIHTSKIVTVMRNRWVGALASWQRVERCFQPSEGNQFLLRAQAQPDPVITQIVE